jgi:tetratricopeptide (TPR) repeat protein
VTCGRLRRGATSILACLVATGACGPRGQGHATTAKAAAAVAVTPAVRSITLPDLSKMVPSVQTQIRNSHAQLSRLAGDPATAAPQLAQAYGDLGKLLMAADYPDAAEPCFTDAAALAPDDYRWPYYLAHLYRERGDLDRAEGFFEQALRLHPDDVSTLVWLGNLDLQQGRPDAATSRFSRALELQANSVSARYGLGRAALAKQDYKTAVSDLEDVLQRDPTATGAHYPLALAYRGLGDEKRAAAQLELRENHEILPADPLMVELDTLLESPQSYESRGIQALNDKKWQEAADLFRKGLDLAPDSAALRHRLGTAFYLMGDAAQAEEAFQAAIHQDPNYFPAQYSLGVLLQDKGRHAEAIERFSAALRARPTYTEARLRLATSLRRVGRAKESLPHYAQVLRENPALTEARFGQAMAFVQLGRYKEARDRLADAVEAYPQEAVFRHGLARLLAAAPDDSVRDGTQAVEIVTGLLKTQPRTLDLGETMAMALAAAGRFAEAVGIQQDLLRAAQSAGLKDVTERLSANLALYQRGKPCLTPWPPGEIP